MRLLWWLRANFGGGCRGTKHGLLCMWERDHQGPHEARVGKRKWKVVWDRD